MSENKGLKVSCWTDMSPTALFGHGGSTSAGAAGTMGEGGVYPGWWDEGGYLGGLYRYPGLPSQGPIFSLYLALRPYLWPNEAVL